ncbi:MYND-type domain-containing protein [Mycena kentingensis (nom. inval.)]|nr:MYND-type domain-containing protein [Mycena kentingensis (nom. inval.)]
MQPTTSSLPSATPTTTILSSMLPAPTCAARAVASSPCASSVPQLHSSPQCGACGWRGGQHECVSLCFRHCVGLTNVASSQTTLPIRPERLNPSFVSLASRAKALQTLRGSHGDMAELVNHLVTCIDGGTMPKAHLPYFLPVFNAGFGSTEGLEASLSAASGSIDAVNEVTSILQRATYAIRGLFFVYRRRRDVPPHGAIIEVLPRILDWMAFFDTFRPNLRIIETRSYVYRSYLENLVVLVDEVPPAKTILLADPRVPHLVGSALLCFVDGDNSDGFDGRDSDTVPPSQIHPLTRPDPGFAPLSAFQYFAEALQVAVPERDYDVHAYYTPLKLWGGGGSASTGSSPPPSLLIWHSMDGVVAAHSSLLLQSAHCHLLGVATHRRSRTVPLVDSPLNSQYNTGCHGSKDFSTTFLAARAARLFLDAIDHLDKPLIIAQTQGKFQLEVMGGGVGYVLHETCTNIPAVHAGLPDRLVHSAAMHMFYNAPARTRNRLIAEAVRADFLTAGFLSWRILAEPDPAGHLIHVRRYVDVELPRALCSLSVVRRLRNCDLGEIQPTQCGDAELGRAWTKLLREIQQRLQTLETYETNRAAHRDLGGCANIECRLLHPTQMLKQCSGCKQMHYCSRACQKVAWRRGHRRFCRTSARGHDLLNLGIDSLSFARTILDEAYHASQEVIRIDFLRFFASEPDEHLPVIIFDFAATGPASLDHAVRVSCLECHQPKHLAEMYPEEVMLARASGGRFCLHFIVAPGDNGALESLALIPFYAPNGGALYAEIKTLGKSLRSRLLEETESEETLAQNYLADLQALVDLHGGSAEKHY